MSPAERRVARALQGAMDVVQFFASQDGLELTDTQVESVAHRLAEHCEPAHELVELGGQG